MNIQTARFVHLSEIVGDKLHLFELLAESSDMTWGDANRTLMDVSRVRGELVEMNDNREDDAEDISDVLARIDAIPQGVYIDMEN
jgi:hypothetical protein